MPTPPELQAYLQGKTEFDDYSQVISLTPKDAAAYNNRGWLYALARQYRKAQDDASKAITLEPKMAAGYDTLGYALAGLGDYKGAVDAYEVAIKLAPSDGEQYVHRAQAYDKLGKHDLAEKDRAKAKMLGYKPEAK